MKLRFVAGLVIFFVLVGVVLGAVLFGPALLTGASSANTDTSQLAAISGNPIVRENALPGSIGWKIPTNRTASIQIQAYANVTSVRPGKTLTFYVSTQKEGTHYWIDIYRLGWYGGAGGRLISSVGDQIGHAQGYYDSVNHRLVNCASCLINKTTGLIEADWQPSYTFTVPSDWTTGVYLAKFTDASGLQTYAPFDVLGNSSSRYVVVTPDTTYEAYNDWGGLSLYGPDINNETDTNTVTQAVKVSFDRPYTQNNGSSQVLDFEADTIHWMERQGYDVSYISNVNLQSDSAQLLHHRAYISLGHDEYWTKEMRDGVERARDKGVGLAFLGANAGYWQMRFEPDSAGVQNRTVVCYKVSTFLNDLTRDSFFGHDNTRVTAEWRDPVLARPENALIGIMYSGLTRLAVKTPWQVSSKVNSPLLNGTGLQAGHQYGCGLVGYEWDRIFANGATPASLQVLGTSSTIIDDGNRPDVSNTTYYIAPSGAMVFATGSIYWTTALDNYRLNTNNLCYFQDPVVPGMQKLMANVMEALAVGHSSQK